ncbi:MAG: 16S rRNA (cytosine(1402)-N(4))-methyltransferase [Enterocloster clostridioformis]
MEQEERKHQRRVRYRGTHPKRYEEKYKELQPEKYPETVAKVIQKGSTPVGMHIPIMVNEILDFLQIQPGQTGLDATLGYGGHTGRMLERLESKGISTLWMWIPLRWKRPGSGLKIRAMGRRYLPSGKLNFANIDQIVRESGPLDFVLADLGVSSMQIDNPSRGFSFKKEGPLDLRLDPLKGEPASERLKGLTRRN